MQRITRYPLLIKQILQYTETGAERDAVAAARDMSEKLLDNINETMREQENHETLRKISQNLWIGQGCVMSYIDGNDVTNFVRRLDLTVPTRNMGPRRLLKQGSLTKAKSGRKLQAFLCSDVLVLTDEGVRNLYRMVKALSVRTLPSLTTLSANSSCTCTSQRIKIQRYAQFTFRCKIS